MLKCCQNYLIMFFLVKKQESLDINNWLSLDENYLNCIDNKLNLLKNKQKKVSQQLPGSNKACKEAMYYVVFYLLEKYPFVYSKKYVNNSWHIYSEITKKLYSMDTSRPLEVLALLTMEDFTIVQKGKDGIYYITASATFFPVGWKLDQRIGFYISKLHNNAPRWEEKEDKSFFYKITKIFDNFG